MKMNKRYILYYMCVCAPVELSARFEIVLYNNKQRDAALATMTVDNNEQSCLIRF